MTQAKHRKEKVVDDEWPPRSTSVLLFFGLQQHVMSLQCH